MDSEKLTCTRLIRISDGRDRQNKLLFYHARCGASAFEVEIKGSLTTAKAILCPKHAALADRDAFLSENGFPLGKVDKKAAEKGFRQSRIQPALALNTSKP